MASNYENIVQYLKIFEGALDDEHELGIIIPPLDRPFPLALTRSDGENFILFELVTDDKDTFAVVCNFSQLNFAIVSLPKETPDQPPRRVGFL